MCASLLRYDQRVSNLTDLLIFFTTLSSALSYGGVALIMIVAAPELIMPLAGFLVAQGELSFTGVLLAGTAGAMVGQLGIYGAARAVGERRVRGFLQRYGRFLLVTERDLERALRLFDRFENMALLFSRVIPTVRSLVSIPAGIQPLPVLRFTFFTALGTALWNAVLLYAGTLLGKNWQALTELLGTYEIVVLALLGLGVAALFTLRIRSRLTQQGY